VNKIGGLAGGAKLCEGTAPPAAVYSQATNNPAINPSGEIMTMNSNFPNSFKRNTKSMM
jgi:hypothetical protein